ncbi:MAG: oligosaccharide flippase family protein [Bacteroidetes bacterium]|nr:oligosaccharide flippase family protein [Bacteroidota bacterium]
MVTYLGVVFGAINVLFIYTSFLSTDQYGLIQVLTSATKIALPFVLLGTQSMIVRFFPHFKDTSRGHNGYLFFLLLIPTLGVSILALFDWLVEDNLISLFFEPTPLIETYGSYVIPWLLFLAWSQVMTRYEMNFHRIAVPAVFNDLFVKIGVPACVVLYFADLLSFQQAVLGIVLLHLLIFIAHILYTKGLGELYLRPRFDRFRGKLLKDMGVFAGFGILGNLGSAIVPHIDTFMVGSLIGLSSAAIYTIPNFVTNVIDVPRRALASISGPIITKAWEENDRQELSKLYKQSSINQFIVGLFMLLALWLSIDDLYALIPEGDNKAIYLSGKYVVLILGSSKVLDMMTGINSELIMYSRHFRVNFYAIIVLAGISVFLNFVLIPIYGINGAALATLISFAIFNLVKYLFLYFREGLQPFTVKTPLVGLLGIGLYFLVRFIPIDLHPFLSIFFRSAVFTGLYILVIWKGNLSPELSALADEYWNKIRNFRK